ncbi:amidohydrolase family protein [Nesterenkonia ebinurensis]|uniref:amidohydrolase family protein n=1 Tax=Nesterenkonia ebinurensis TaxID=2608252 RepID=UPI00123DA68C|nr:amidohydrolase family protein [Nesterenkonia ebinurensis]
MSELGDLDITDATLIPAPDADQLPGVTIRIRSGVITQIERGSAPAGGEEYDAGGRVVVPGFWNCHVHLTERVWARAATVPAGRLQQELDDMFLVRGFTGAVDLGSHPRDHVAVKHRVSSGELVGPRLLTAGMGLYPPRGLPFYVRADLPWYIRPLLPQSSSRGAARRAMGRSQRRGAEVAKLFTGSYVQPDRIKPMPLEIARVAAEEAHRQGRLVFAHTSDREGLRIAVEAGVDVIAHVPDAPEGTEPLLQEAARRGMWMVPTLEMFAQTVTRDPSYLEPVYHALGVFLEAGGRLLFGTDVGYLTDRRTRGELEALDACGLSVADVLTMLTTAPAEALSVGSGRLDAGEPADLVVIDHRQLNNPAQLADVLATIRSGRVVWPRESA